MSKEKGAVIVFEGYGVDLRSVEIDNRKIADFFVKHKRSFQAVTAVYEKDELADEILHRCEAENPPDFETGFSALVVDELADESVHFLELIAMILSYELDIDLHFLEGHVADVEQNKAIVIQPTLPWLMDQGTKSVTSSEDFRARLEPLMIELGFPTRTDWIMSTFETTKTE